MEFQRELKDLVVSGVEETEKELGRGSYGVVVELKVNGLVCAGKKLHPEFFAIAIPQTEKRAIEARFVEECRHLSRLRHPNIVQLLGVYFPRAPSPSRVPTLVMEYLPMTLAQCLESYENIRDYRKFSILKDVGLGVQHIHNLSPPIVHRDLTANNVLLSSSMNGKIADLGVAKIVNLNAAQLSAKMTMCPGTPAYMPPEALSNRPAYDTSLDCFSFGNLLIHTIVQKWPLPLPLLQADPRNPGQLRPLTEVERRAEFLEEMGQHPLKRLAEQCLHNDPRRRPTAATIVRELELVCRAHPPPFANVIEMDQSEGDNTASVPPVPESKCSIPNLSSLNMKIEWTQLPDLPEGCKHGQAIVYDGKVYCSAPVTDSEADTYIGHVHVFDFTSSHQWTTLASVSRTWFALALFQAQLVVVGGWGKVAGVTQRLKQALTWDATSLSWICSLPEMPTARSKATAIGYEQYLLVAGGQGSPGAKFLESVEILDYGSHMWFQAIPLPFVGNTLKAAHYEGKWFLIGGDTHSPHSSVSYISNQTLVDSATAGPGASSTTWTSSADLPCRCSPLAVWGDTLIAVGGIVSQKSESPSGEVTYKTLSRSSRISAYCPHTDTWWYLGDIPTQGCAHSVVTLPTGELLVIGGRSDTELFLKSVFMARLVPKMSA